MIQINGVNTDPTKQFMLFTTIHPCVEIIFWYQMVKRLLGEVTVAINM